MPSRSKQARHEKVAAAKAKAARGHARRRDDAPPGRGVAEARSRSSRATSCATTSSTPASGSTVATPRTVRPIVAEVGVLPRVHGSRAVHPRRDAGPGRGHARHRPGRADDRRARGRLPRALHAALQLPALFGGRGRPPGLARSARDRPRQARLARHPSAAAGEGAFPYTIRVVSEITEIERLELDGDGLRHLAGADGCGRAAAARRSRASPWA